MKSWRRTTSVPKGVDEVPVMIVSAGAGGSAMAALLAKYGVESLVVKKRREVFLYPKAHNLSFRSLEILRGLGLQDVVHPAAAGVPEARLVTGIRLSIDQGMAQF